MKKTTDARHAVGALGEKIAVRYLRLHGYTVKERNWRTGHLELDIIAASLRTLAFVEVKTRVYTEETLHTAPPPRTAVHQEKQRLTRQAARTYLHEHPTRRAPRMDVIEVSLVKKPNSDRFRVAEIHHIKAAY